MSGQKPAPCLASTQQPNGKPQANDGYFIYDTNLKDYVFAYRKDVRRRRTIRLIDNVTFDDTLSTKTSKEINTKPYGTFLLFIDLSVTSIPIDILYEVEYSFDGTNWGKLMLDYLGDLRYEDGAGAKKEMIKGTTLASYLRLKVTATGTTANNKFTTSVDIHLVG